MEWDTNALCKELLGETLTKIFFDSGAIILNAAKIRNADLDQPEDIALRYKTLKKIGPPLMGRPLCVLIGICYRKRKSQWA